MTNREKIVEQKLQEYRGWLPRALSWDNYEDIPYWYDYSTNTIQSNCGVSVPFNYNDEDITIELIDKVLSELEDKIIEYFKETKNIELFVPDD